MTTTPRFLAQVARNEAKDCGHPRCTRNRVGLYRWCNAHRNTARRLGHPEAVSFRRSTWTKYREEVSGLFALNDTHPGLLQVTQWVETWMAKAAADARAFPGAREMSRLHRHGVTPLQVIAEACAWFSWEATVPDVFPDDRSRDFALSRAVFGLAPRDRRPISGGGIGGTWGRSATTKQSFAPKALESSLAHVGKHLRQSLAPFLANVRSALEERRRIEADPQADLRAPFKTTASAPQRAPGALPFPLQPTKPKAIP